jgi:hypothetical protein
LAHPSSELASFVSDPGETGALAAAP